jgi:hypothetical protein
MTTPVYQLVTEGLIDPEQTAFFANNPQSFGPPNPVVVDTEQDRIRRRHLEESAIALAAAFMVIRNLMSKELQRQQASFDADVPNIVAVAWKKFAPIWLKLAVPALKQAYALGSTAELTDQQLELLATDYANNLGSYVNVTSAEALAQGFNDQLAQKWSEPVAWVRATEAYGLDKQQMKTYVSQVMTLQNNKQELIPMVARAAVDKALVTRAEKLGDNEAFHASKLGQSMVWLVQQKNGTLPPDAQKEWVTADDERVCPVCGPLNKKRVKLDEQWQTIEGDRIWAPGIHPRCRCDVRLIYPEITNDTWSVVEKIQKADWDENEHPRSRTGRFSDKPQRQAAPRRGRLRPVAEREPVRPEVADLLRQAEELGTEVVEQVKNPFAVESDTPSPFAIDAQTKSPFAATASPFAATESPFAQKEKVAEEIESPFLAKPRRRRTVLVYLPGQKEPEETEVEEDSDEEEAGPFWTFWNSVREADPKDHSYQWGETADTDTRNDRIRVGQIINFDFHVPGRPDPAVVANQYDGNPMRLAEMAISIGGPTAPRTMR